MVLRRADNCRRDCASRRDRDCAPLVDRLACMAGPIDIVRTGEHCERGAVVHSRPALSAGILWAVCFDRVGDFLCRRVLDRPRATGICRRMILAGLGPRTRITLGLWDLRLLLLLFLGFCDSRNTARRPPGLGLGSSAWASSAEIE